MFPLYVGMFGAIFATALCCTAVAQAPTPIITSPQVPIDVSVPPDFSGNPIAFFDDYSWRAFIALVWPALKDVRGMPDSSKNIGATGPRVFETYKDLWEVFHTDGSAPAPWQAFEPRQFNPCNVATAWGDLTLASFSKFGDLGQAAVGSLVGPLVAQPNNSPSFVRFDTAYNQVSFAFINNPTSALPASPLYLRSNLDAAAPVSFPVGSITIKSAWIEMAHIVNPSRYYTRVAWVIDPSTGAASQMLVGLVGLHIVQKTATRPQWIWSTFEQVDNVPEAPTDTGPFNFNDGSGTAMPAGNKDTLNPLTIPPIPYNVNRLKKIHDSTQATNSNYRAALSGTVWANYKLVMTQWPIPASQPALPGDPSHTFPGAPPNDATAFSNVTMETFDQAAIGKGCMNCHTQTKGASDFVWSLEDHAFPSTLPELLIRKQEFRAFQSIIKGTQVGARTTNVDSN